MIMKQSKWLALTPPLYLSLSAMTFGMTLHTQHQGRRWWFLPIFLTFSIMSMQSSKYFWFSSTLMSLWNQAMTLYILHAVSLLYIERWPVPTCSPVTTNSGSARSRGAQLWNWRLCTTYRLLGNPQLISVRRESDESLEDTQSSFRQLSVFIFPRSMKLPVYYYISVHLMPTIFSQTIVEIIPDDVGPEQQKLIRRIAEITAREAVVRAYTAIAWILESFLYLDGANAILGIVFVLTGADRPAEWPALFSSPMEATSLRRFWSRFWHKLANRPYKNYGHMVAGRLIRLRPGTVPFKAVVALVVFGLSGVTHALVNWQGGLEDWNLEILWFLLNFLGCPLELAFLTSLWKIAAYLGLSHELKQIEESWLGQFIGYSWVFAFFFWSVPKWRYPRLERQAMALERFRRFVAKFQAAEN